MQAPPEDRDSLSSRQGSVSHTGGGVQVRIAAAGLAVLFTLGPSLAGFTGQTARAADLTHVGGWATLASVTPAAGCELAASIEENPGR